jgi:hypothetical protein
MKCSECGRTEAVLFTAPGTSRKVKTKGWCRECWEMISQRKLRMGYCSGRSGSDNRDNDPSFDNAVRVREGG